MTLYLRREKINEFHLALPETVGMPSARGFAEFIPSDTRQTCCVLSAAVETFGKHIALGKNTLCRVP